MHNLLIENDIRYTIIPPGKSDKQAHSAMLKTIFDEKNVLETKNVRRGSDDTHYQRGQLLQALATHLSKRQQQEDVG
jgi:precorrin-4 methylase